MQQTYKDSQGNVVDLVLYQTTTCPYCQRVLQFAQQHGLQLPSRDTSRDPEARRHLVEHGGKRQVPCLFINGTPMYESADIIAYLETVVVA